MRELVENLQSLNPDVIALSPDYDNSASPDRNAGDDFPPAETLLNFAYQLLINSNAELRLYVGSLRNSRYLNALNQVSHNNGCCFQHQIRFVETLKKKHPAFENRITLVKLIAEDIHLAQKEGFCFDLGAQMSARERKTLAYSDQPEIPWLDDKKNSIHYLQLHHLRQNSNRPLFIFTDDRKTILDSAYTLFSETQPDWMPCNTAFQLIHFEAREFVTSNPYPLIQGHGMIDTHYKTTVKFLHDYTRAEQTRHQKSGAALLSVIPNKFALLLHSLNIASWSSIISSIDAVSENKKPDCYATLLHLAIEKDALIHAKKIARFSFNLSLLHNNITPIEAAIKKGFWELVKIIAAHEGDESDTAHYNAALRAAIEAEKFDIAIQLAKSMPPASRLLEDNDFKNSLRLAFNKKQYDLLHILLNDQDKNNESFIRTYNAIFMTACYQENVDAILTLAPFSPSLNNDLLFAGSHKKWSLIEKILDAPCNANITFSLDILITLLLPVLQSYQLPVLQSYQLPTAKYLLLNCNSFTESQKKCFSEFVDIINYNCINHKPLTKTLLKNLLVLSKSTLIPPTEAYQELCKFLAQVDAISGDQLTNKMLDVFLVISHLPIVSRKNDEGFIVDMLLFSALMPRHECKEGIIRLQTRLDANANSWASIITFLYNCYTNYELIMYGNTNVMNIKKAVEFILLQFPPGKPLHIDSDYIAAFIQKIPKHAIKNEMLLKITDAHFQQPALHGNKTCIAAHRALRFIIASIDDTNPTALSDALFHFESAKTISPSKQTNLQALDAFDAEQELMCCAFFRGPTSYRQLHQKLKDVGLTHALTGVAHAL